MVEMTPVSRSLDKKLKVLGFEVPDVLAIFLFLALLNFVFAGHSKKLFLTWGPTLVLAGIIRVGKRGKPDNYILHLAQYHLSPKELTAYKTPQTKFIIKRGVN